MRSAEQGKSQAVYYGHSANGDGEGAPELLCDHLGAVARRAAGFATPFGAAEQAYAAGMLHDLGKYADQFQLRLRDPGEPSRDHWAAGAAVLAASYRDLGILPALAVAAHHAGLEDLPFEARTLCSELGRKFEPGSRIVTESNRAILHQRFLADGLELPKVTNGIAPAGNLVADMLDVRMLFSALVDADFLETEAHFAGDAAEPRRPRPAGPELDLDQAIDGLAEVVAAARQKHAGSPMSGVRDRLLADCIAAAASRTGLFTLSAPTGAAKTLALLAFALHHARAHGLRRIVLVMPFLNIIEQTAEVYRSVFSQANGFPPHTVVEHHSLAGRKAQTRGEDDDRDPMPRLLAVNWDAPVILTTSVQFLESLMAARSSRCRKLHRLAKSVILFDEVQTIPHKLALATLATLSRLAEPEGPYGTTIVFATATQPAFDSLDERVRPLASGGWRPREIVSDSAATYARAAARVRVSWRHDTEVNLDELAVELAERQRVLCIVNLKRHAVALAEALRDQCIGGVLHLSTNMCPVHRAKVLRKVGSRLKHGKCVRLVATQCVEAGVDLDFPVVYRAMAPLEAISQAAGRCNRHGAGETGEVVVFKPEDERGIYPPGYREAADATEIFLNRLAAEGGSLDRREVINDPAALRAYYRHLYTLTGRSTGQCADEAELLAAIEAGDFETTANLYRLIKEDSISVVVPYDQPAFNRLHAELAEARRMTPEFIRRWRGEATAHCVSLCRPKREAAIWNHLAPVQFSRRREIDNAEAEWFFALSGLEYDKLTGLSGKCQDSWLA